MELLLIRRWPKPTYTIGVLYVDGVKFSETLEDKDRGLTQDMPTTEIYKKKVYGYTAIPKGRYRIDMDTVSPKFKNRNWAVPYAGKIPRLVDVPCWTGVLIHPLSTPNDSLGCVGVGENKVKGKIINSQKTFFRLMDEYLVPAHKKGEEIWLTIK